MKTPLWPRGNRLRLGSVFCAVALMALSGCTAISTYSPPVISRPPSGTTPATGGAVDGWTGTYRTVLPCNHCAGVQLNLTLYRDATYDLLTQELGTSNPPITRRGGFVQQRRNPHHAGCQRPRPQLRHPATQPPAHAGQRRQARYRPRSLSFHPEKIRLCQLCPARPAATACAGAFFIGKRRSCCQQVLT